MQFVQFVVCDSWLLVAIVARALISLISETGNWKAALRAVRPAAPTNDPKNLVRVFPCLTLCHIPYPADAPPYGKTYLMSQSNPSLSSLFVTLVETFFQPLFLMDSSCCPPSPFLAIIGFQTASFSPRALRSGASQALQSIVKNPPSEEVHSGCVPAFKWCAPQDPTAVTQDGQSVLPCSAATPLCTL